MLAVTSFAYAGPPFLTDDPEPVPYHGWEVNYGISKTWRDGSAAAALPAIDINYGVLPDIQLHAQPRYSTQRSAGETQSGVDDTEVGVKYRFLHVERGENTFMAGVYPMVQLPTGARRLGPSRGKLQTFLPLWAQANLDKWTLYGGAGYRINQGPDNRNSVFTGVTSLYQVAAGLQLGGEVFHETADAKDSAGAAGFNLGGIYSLAPKFNLLFSGGRNLGGASDARQRTVFLALQVLH